MKTFLFLSFTLLAIIACAVPADAIDRPIVFIPGILGSRHVDQQDKIIWGDVYSLSRLHTLTVTDGPDNPNDHLRADSIITNIQVFGPIKVKQYSSLRHTLTNLGYQPGVTYFEFPYDWRQSNFKTANDFAEFVKHTPQLNHHQFDILAPHSDCSLRDGWTARWLKNETPAGHRASRGFESYLLIPGYGAGASVTTTTTTIRSRPGIRPSRIRLLRALSGNIERPRYRRAVCRASREAVGYRSLYHTGLTDPLGLAIG